MEYTINEGLKILELLIVLSMFPYLLITSLQADMRVKLKRDQLHLQRKQ